MKRILLLIVLLGFSCGVALAQEQAPKAQKFKACDNKGAAGFFWVDTATGMTWLQDAASMTWRYAGKPEGAKAGADGTYMPHENHSGQGVFILNVTTGEGWWTDGVKWKALGTPKTK